MRTPSRSTPDSLAIMSGLVHQEPEHAVHGMGPDPTQEEDHKTQCCPEMDLHRSCTVLGCQSEPDADVEREYDPRNLNISFAGCGFLGIYHLGVAAAFSHFLPDCQYDKLCGASAGALAATGLVAGIPVTKMVTTLLEVAGEARRHFGGALNPSYNITDVLFEKLRQILPEDIHIRANGKLFVSVTKIMDGKNVMIENYMSRDELIEAIVASAFIPGFSGAMPPVFRGCRIIDGGFSCNLPDIFDNTITVSPFAGSAIICPLDDGKVRAYPVHRLHFSDQGTDVTFANAIRLKHVMYPPSLEELNKILMAGFKDGHRFLRTEGFIKCTQCLTIRSEMTACEDLISCDEFEDSLPQAISHTFESFRNRAENLLLHSSKRFSLFNKTCRFVFNVASYTPPVYLMKKSIQVAHGTTVLLAKTFVTMVNMLEVLIDIRLQSEAEKYLGHTLKAFIKHDDWISVTAPKGSRPVKKRVPKRAVSMDINISQFGRGHDEDDEDDFSSGGSAVVAGCNEDGVDLVQIRVENIVNEGNPDPTTDEEARQLQADNLLNATRSENISRSVSHGWFSFSCSNPDPTTDEEARQLQADNLLNATRSENISRSVSRLGSRIASKRNSLQSSRQHSRTGSRRGSITTSRQTSESEGGETLENIRRVTERQNSVLGYYYRNDKGDLVMVNIYDISNTDPADILGNDILNADSIILDPEEVHDRLRSVPLDRFISNQSTSQTSSSSHADDST
ncbi:uncharacterized protein LOC131878136 [Tigriopus californicus]|uniref:uncharacterized protein LOC131878136 n=1 Tax=Tigriopus californicus TaxID=6832 RepID=UPI0027DAA16E|nr:uncharacterized protein LOC131878136 [Tigriopus californicus]